METVKKHLKSIIPTLFAILMIQGALDNWFGLRALFIYVIFCELLELRFKRTSDEDESEDKNESEDACSDTCSSDTCSETCSPEKTE